MKAEDATAFIQNGMDTKAVQTWADLGCGSGTFTRALVSLLPEGSKVFAVDKQAQSLENFIKANFERDELPLPPLDGILLGNAIHFVKDNVSLIHRLEHYFKHSPQFLIVEYDTRWPSPWVPYPISFEKLNKLFIGLGYQPPGLLGKRPSIYSKTEIYAALIQKK